MDHAGEASVKHGTPAVYALSLQTDVMRLPQHGAGLMLITTHKTANVTGVLHGAGLDDLLTYDPNNLLKQYRHVQLLKTLIYVTSLDTSQCQLEA